MTNSQANWQDSFPPQLIRPFGVVYVRVEHWAISNQFRVTVQYRKTATSSILLATQLFIDDEDSEHAANACRAFLAKDAGHGRLPIPLFLDMLTESGIDLGDGIDTPVAIIGKYLAVNLAG